MKTVKFIPAACKVNVAHSCEMHAGCSHLPKQDCSTLVRIGLEFHFPGLGFESIGIGFVLDSDKLGLGYQVNYKSTCTRTPIEAD